MNCQNCDAPVLIADERCPRCGAKLLHQRLVIGVPRPEEFTLTSEVSPAESVEPSESDPMPFPEHDPVSGPSPEPSPRQFPPRPEIRPADSIEKEIEKWFAQPRWGGFFRRAGAAIIDLIIVLVLCSVMGAMAYVGYRVGLSAHDRMISWQSAQPLVSYLTLATMGLASAYFVLFHGMAGQTIGKWLLRLRVVGPDRRALSYRQALLRWIGAVGLGAASFGLAFLWVLWQREKRGWHDFLARTWVVRE